MKLPLTQLIDEFLPETCYVRCILICIRSFILGVPVGGFNGRLTLRAVEPEEVIGPGFSFMDLAAMCDPRDAHDFRRVVDDVHHAPVTDADAPLIFVALQLFASCWPWSVAQSFEFADNARQHVIR